MEKIHKDVSLSTNNNFVSLFTFNPYNIIDQLYFIVLKYYCYSNVTILQYTNVPVVQCNVRHRDIIYIFLREFSQYIFFNNDRIGV